MDIEGEKRATPHTPPLHARTIEMEHLTDMPMDFEVFGKLCLATCVSMCIQRKDKNERQKHTIIHQE